MTALLWWTVLAVASGDAERGKRLAGLAGCRACHTSDDGEDYAGGFAVVTSFGTFYGSNLTPAGLEGWRFDDFRRAMRNGRAPDGRPYVPSFPYDQYTGMTESDLRDIWAWLQQLPPVEYEPPPHNAPRRATSRFWLGLWQKLYLREGPSEGADRGEYLVDHVGHCGGCHTPRNRFGARVRRRALQGSADPNEPAPTLFLDWSEEDWSFFLATGTLPDGDVVGGEMWRVISEGTQLLSDADRASMAAWLGHLQD